ncbi:MAG TPA: SPFH domain-containing protein [Candidatus Atribacteria bacterium]|nr:SPFH domain-containing protein [Candidatus Atribacteria bacterium]HPT78217.1 SPFH domain-containing protein [Candidatus Atribacteria bacterium]
MTDKIKRALIIGIIVLVAIILLNESMYIVREDEVAVVNRFGEVVGVTINPMDMEVVENGLKTRGMDVAIRTTKGLAFKLPFIETVEKFSSKYMTYKSETATINTYDSRRIDLSIYAQYRVVNPALFKMTMGSVYNANRLMDDRVYPVVIQTANTLRFNEFFHKDKVTNALESGREELNKALTAQYGVYIVDIGIYRKNFPQANIAAIEEKMTQEIQKESEKLIAEGESLLRRKKAETDRKKQEIVANAVEESAIIKAEADAEAARIYEEALKIDLEFYRFINRMKSLKEMKDTTVFLDESNDFIDYINNR